MPRAHIAHARPRHAATALALTSLALVSGPALAQPAPAYIEPTPPVACTEYADGQVRNYTTQTIWRQMCSGTPGALSARDLQAVAAEHARQMADAEHVVTIDSSGASGLRSAGLNIVFNINAANAPAGYATAFTLAEQYIESKFSTPVTVTINVSWASLGQGILGATGSSFVGNVSYTSSRNGLINGMDASDVLQAYLPAGSTVPVRFNAQSASVSSVSGIDWTRANYRAAVGSVSGPDCSMQFSTNFTFDYDPTNGVTSGQTSMVDVIVHEVGHCLGFVSAADDSSPSTIRSLDLFRFARTDRAGIGNTNPDSLADFQTVAREVCFDNPGNDDANVDFISAEYQMSDGSPYQASHFHQQSASPALAIGIMQPALASGVTFGPDYYRPADLAAFNAIGWTIATSGGGGGCAADADGNGQIQPADVATFINQWTTSLANGTTTADFDHNGQVQPADVAAFVSAWLTAVNNGC